jgi:hypothetical protein
MHLVYASPGTIDAYRKTGQFPDGAVLVKEVFAASTRGMTTGTASHADVLKGWFVMVKDSRNSHPGNPLWGDEWGWSWFDADKPMKTTSTSFASDCLSCHVPAQASDWIYSKRLSGAPSLKRRFVSSAFSSTPHCPRNPPFIAACYHNHVPSSSTFPLRRTGLNVILR